MRTTIQDKLAVEGGQPVRTESLPLEFPGVHYMDEEEIRAAVRVLKFADRSGVLTTVLLCKKKLKPSRQSSAIYRGFLRWR